MRSVLCSAQPNTALRASSAPLAQDRHAKTQPGRLSGAAYSACRCLSGHESQAGRHLGEGHLQQGGWLGEPGLGPGAGVLQAVEETTSRVEGKRGVGIVGAEGSLQSAAGCSMGGGLWGVRGWHYCCQRGGWGWCQQWRGWWHQRGCLGSSTPVSAGGGGNGVRGGGW